MAQDFGQPDKGKQNELDDIDFSNLSGKVAEDLDFGNLLPVKDRFKDDTVYPENGLIDKIKLGLMDLGVDTIRPEAEDMEPGKSPSWYEAPNVRVIDGKRYLTRTTESQNDDNLTTAYDKVLSSLKENEIAPEDMNYDEGDKYVYGYNITDPTTGKTKFKLGFDKKGFENRNKNEPFILQNAEVLFSKPIKNAEQLERRWLSSKGVMENKLVDFGNAKKFGYAGATEFVNFKGYKPTEIQKKAMSKVDQLLSPDQKAKQKEVTDAYSGALEKIMQDKNATNRNQQIDKLENLAIERKDDISSLKIGRNSKLKRLKDITPDDSVDSVVKALQNEDKKTGMMGSLSASGSEMPRKMMARPQMMDLYTKIIKHADNVDISKMTQEGKLDKIEDFMSQQTQNLGEMAEQAYRYYNSDRKKGREYLQGLQAYMTTDATPGQVGRGIKEVFLDETTAASLGTGVVVKTALKKAAIEKLIKMMTQKGGKYAGQDFAKIAARAAPNRAAAKIAEENFKKNIVKTSVLAGGVEGALVGGTVSGRDAIMESRAYNEDFDWGKVAMGTAAGTVVGATITGGIAKILKKISTKKGEIPIEEEWRIGPPEKRKEILESLDPETQKEVMKFVTVEQMGRKVGVVSGRLEQKEIEREQPDITPGSVEHQAQIKQQTNLQQVHRAEITQEQVVKDAKKKMEKVELTKKEHDDILSKYRNLDYENMSKEEVAKIDKEIAKDISEATKQKNIDYEPIVAKTGLIPEKGQRKNKGPISDLLEQNRQQGPARRSGELNHYMSTKVGSSVLSQLSEKVTTKNMPWKKKIENLLDAWDNNLRERKVYGRAYPKYKELYTNSKVRDSAHRKDFEIDHLNNLLDELPNEKKYIPEAKEILARVRKLEKERAEMLDLASSPEIESKAKKIFYSQDDKKALEPKNSWINERQERLSEDFKAKRKVMKDTDWEGRNTPDSIEQVVEREMQKSVHIANEASDTLKKRTGNRWDRQTIDDKIKIGNGEYIKKIENHWGRKADLEAFKRKEINADELAYREYRRIRDEIDSFRNAKMPEEKLNIELKKIKARLDDIGYKTSIDDKTFKFIKKETYENSTGGVKTPKQLEKEAEREASRQKENLIHRESYINKLVKYVETGVLPRWGRSTYSKHKMGEVSISDNVLKAIKSKAVSRDDIADMFFPLAKSEKEFEYLKRVNEEKIFKKVNDKTAKKINLDRRNFLNKAKAIIFRKHTWDASNSMGQIVSGLLGSESLASKTNMLGKLGSEEFRLTIAKKMMEKEPTKFGKIDKDLVKEIYTPHFYGQAEKGAMDKMMKVKGWDAKKAAAFRDLYYDMLEDTVPELAMFKKKIESMISKGKIDTKFQFKTWDGTKINGNLPKSIEGKARIKGQDVPLSAISHDLNTKSRALMPLIIQSIDASILKKIQAKTGIKATHDAYHTLNAKQLKQVKELYLQELKGIFESDLLHNIMKDLGYKGRPLKEKNFMDSSKLDITNMLGEEHKKGQMEIRTEKDFRAAQDKQILDENRLIEEFMAGDNVHKLEVGEYKVKVLTDAGYTDMSTRNINDNPIAYQLASAHQRSNFDENFIIPPPNNLTKHGKELWIKKQREIFDEMRAGLEMNPRMNGLLKGKRRFTQESGKPIGDSYKNKTYQKILQEEIVRHKIIWNDLPKLTKDILTVKGKDYNRLKKEAIRIEKKQLKTKRDILISEIVIRARTPQRNKKSLLNSNSYAIRQLTNSPENDEYQRLSKMRLTQQKDVEKRAEIVHDYIIDMAKKDKLDLEDLTRNLLNTGFRNIKEMTKDSAEAFRNKHGALYEQARPYIKAAARALNEKSKEVGYFRNTSKEILEEIGYGKEDIRDMHQIVDKLISIEKMSEKNWNYIENIRNTESFNFSMSLLDGLDQRADILFVKNPLDKTRNFVKEVYTNKRKIDGTIDADDKYIDGLLSYDREQLQVGKEIAEHIVPPIELKTDKAINEWAEKLNIKITNHGFRKVVQGSQKYKTGRTRDFAKILSATQESLEHKEMARSADRQILKQVAEGSELFSKKAKENFIEIDPNFRKALPRNMQEIKYVHKDFMMDAIGRPEARMTNSKLGKKLGLENNQWAKITDRLWKESVLTFKQNAVLKNIGSYKNALLINQSLALSLGINPAKAYRLQKEAYKEIAKNEKLKQRITIRKAKGLSVKHLSRILENSELRKMEKAGLSINNVDGVRGENKLLNQLVGEAVGKTASSVGNTLMMNQNTRIGKASVRFFSNLDTSGRYMMAKHFMSEHQGSMDIANAVKKSNSLFADMDQIAPALIERLDDYGIAPFLKWFTQSGPGIAKALGQNYKKAMLVGSGLYAFGMATNSSMGGWNPMEGVIDYTESLISSPSDKINEATSDTPWQQAIRKITGTFVPGTINKIGWKLYQKGDDITLKDVWRTVWSKMGGHWDKVKDKKGNKLMPNDNIGGVQNFMEQVVGLPNPNHNN